MPRKMPAKKTTLGADLIEGMKLVLAHQQGKVELEQVWPRPIDVKAIRKRVKMSQAEFSRAYGIQQTCRYTGVGAGREAAGLGRARVSDGHRERTSSGAAGARGRMKGAHLLAASALLALPIAMV